MKMNCPFTVDTKRDDLEGRLWVAITFHEPEGDQVYGFTADEVDFLLATLPTARALLEGGNLN